MDTEISKSFIPVCGGSSFVLQRDGLPYSTITSSGRILLSILLIPIKRGLKGSIHVFV
jgi:hypothetical protein